MGGVRQLLCRGRTDRCRHHLCYAKLVEHTENDAFWGDGGDGGGRNELGRVLMAVRERLRSERDDQAGADS